jgi:hypothetical protein
MRDILPSILKTGTSVDREDEKLFYDKDYDININKILGFNIFPPLILMFSSSSDL